ncbi:MAG TPA: BadF/BadG/BcrA/BcrD ATPase family protein [Candidatus Acidoferrum sp.]|nr:BadF/BadG/BcrA/BcrD ATPase family protein [Candidatus Acidoferrum sp.]
MKSDEDKGRATQRQERNARADNFDYSFQMRIGMGFDGGGTKTDCLLLLESGKVLGRGRAGASNPSRIGIEAAAQSVRDAAIAALANAEIQMAHVTDVCAGLAGVALAERARAMIAHLREFFGTARFELCTDLDLALASAGPPPAMVLVAGTGSAAIGHVANRPPIRSGGHGPKQSDEGSAFAIGKNVVKHLAALTLDGESLRERIVQLFPTTSLQLLASLEGAEADAVYPRIFPLVAIAADEGDELAQKLLNEAAQNLASFVAEVKQQLHLGDEIFTLGKTGGMMGRSKYFDAQLNQALHDIAPRAKIQHLQTPLVEIAAKRALGL